MIGSREWMTQQQGRLSPKEKLKLIQQVLMPVSIAYAQRFLNPKITPLELDLGQIKLPDTAIVKDAIDALEHCSSIALIDHSWRSLYWAIAIAKHKSWHYDLESLTIASLMHDLGLNDAPANASCHCFTYVSALKAEKLCQQHHYPADKTHNIADAICLHMNGYLDEDDRSLSTEVVLLQQATACDVIGTDLNSIPLQFRGQVLAQHPRAGFKQQFRRYLKDEAKRHPHSRTALLRQLGLPLMMAYTGFVAEPKAVKH